MSAVQLILTRLPDPKRNGRGWYARCPAHDDRTPSLSISEGEDGRVLLHCHAGCSVDAVCRALGLKTADLFAPTVPTPTQVNGAQRPRIVALYHYTDGDGQLLYQVVRYEPKGFRQRRPDGTGGWIWNIRGVQRVLYHLRRLRGADKESFIFVVEGEKDTDRLVAQGMIATTTAGGAGKAHLTDLTPLHGRHVAIIPDNDTAGRDHAEQLAKLLHAECRSVRVVNMPGLPDKGDVSDWLDAGGDVEDLVRLVESTPTWEPSDRRSATAGRRQVQPYPVHDLPAALCQYVEAASAATATDTCFIALPLLAMLASCIGTTRAVRLKRRWRELAIVWMAVIAESGTGKTPALQLVLSALRRRQRMEFDRHGEAMALYERELAEYEKAKAAYRKSKCSDPPKMPDPPACIRHIVSDTTTEALAPILETNRRGVLLARDELAGWIGDLDRYAQTKGGDAPRWLSIWSGEPITIDRKTSGTIYVHCPAVSVCGGIQPGTLRRATGTEHREDGMLARFLLGMPARSPHVWTEADLPCEVEERMVRIVERLLELQHNLDGDGYPAPVEVGLAADARERFIAWHNTHAEEVAEVSGDLASAFAKMPAYAARLALVLHTARWADGEPVGEVIDLASLRNAIGLVEWHKQEARRVCAMLDATEDDARLQGLVEQVRCKGGAVSVRAWQRTRSHRTSTVAEAELNELVVAELGRWEYPATGPKGGGPSKHFVLSDTPDTDDTPNREAESGVLSVSEMPEGSAA